MARPERDAAMGWVGKTVVDRDGAVIGACTAVFGDDSGGLAEWVCADVGGASVFVPAVDAVESGEGVRVTVTRVDALSAPLFGGAGHLSGDEKAALNRHYRIEGSASEILPSIGEAGPSVAGVSPDAAAATPASTPSTSGDDVQGAAPEADMASEEFGEPAPAVRSDRRLLVWGVPAGSAALLAALLAARRRRNRRPPTLGERLVGRIRVASVAVTRRGVELGGSAAPVMTAAGRAVSRAGRRATPLAAAAGSSMAQVAKRGVHRGQQVGEAVESVPEVVAERSRRLQQRGWAVMGKLTMGLALGAGYVLGARAGRQRFEQLKQAAESVGQRPQVQQATEKLRSVAGEKLQTQTGSVKQRTSGVSARLRRRRETMAAGNGEQASGYPSTRPGMAGEQPPAPGVTQGAFGPPDPMDGDPGSRP
jgi:glutathione S-transferase